MKPFQHYGCFPSSILQTYGYLGDFLSSDVFFKKKFFFGLGFQSFHYKSLLGQVYFQIFFVEVIINAIVFLISFSLSSLSMFRESTDFHMPIFVFCRSIKFLNKIYDLIVESCRYFDFFFSNFSPGFFNGLLVFQKYVLQCLCTCKLAAVSPTSYSQFFPFEDWYDPNRYFSIFVFVSIAMDL